MHKRIILSISLFWIIEACLFGAGLDLGSSKVTPQQEQEMERWIKRLGNPSWYLRREAGKKLLDFGLDALEVLKKAETDDDPSIASAARFYSRILSRGMIRSTDSEKVKELLGRYGENDLQNAQLIQKLCELPSEESIPLLMRILIYENQEECTLQVALAILWELPYEASLPPIASWLPSGAEEESADETAPPPQENRPSVAALRKEYVEQLHAALPEKLLTKLGVQVLKQLLELEMRLQPFRDGAPGNALEAELEKWCEERANEFRVIIESLPSTSSIRTRKMQLWLDYAYCVGDLLLRGGMKTLQKKWADQVRLPNITHLAGFFQNDQERLADLFYRIDLIEKLAGRGHWSWSHDEAEHLLKTIQQVEMPLASSPLATLLHYCGNHVRAAEILQQCLRNVLILNVMERLGIAENDWEVRAQYYLACQAGVENQGATQKKLLREILEKDPLEADTLILCYRIAKTDTDAAWREETETRIQTALDEIVARINESVTTEKAQDQNLFAWLAANTNRRLAEALAYAQAAVQTFPESGGIRDTLAHVLFAQGRVEEAVAEQKKAVASRPYDLEIRRNLWLFEKAASLKN